MKNIQQDINFNLLIRCQSLYMDCVKKHFGIILSLCFEGLIFMKW